MNRTLIIIASYFFVQIGLALLNPFDFISISYKSIYIYFSFILCLITYSFFYKIPKSCITEIRYKKYIYYYTNFYFIIALGFFLTHIYVKYKFGISSQELRDLYYFGQESGELTLFNYLYLPMSFLNGFSFFLFLSFLVNLKNQINKHNLYLFVKILISIVLINTAESGRLGFFIVGLSMLLFFIKFNKVYSILKKNLLFTRIAIVGVLLVSYMSFSRLNDFSFTKFLYTYLVGPVFLFDYSINDFSSLVYNTQGRFGFSFMSLDWFIVGAYNLTNVDKILSLFTISDPYLTYGYMVNDQITVNAFFTFFTFFYIDYYFLAPLFIILYHFFFSVIGKQLRTKNILELDIFLSFFLIIGSIFNPLNSLMFFISLLCILFINPHISHK